MLISKSRLLPFVVSIVLLGCHGAERGDEAVNKKRSSSSQSNQELKLPFIGKRYFETRHGIAGTGTPHWKVEISSNRDVVFSFYQLNQADKTTETKGTYYAGKFQRIIKCVFKEWDNETRYYEILPDRIYDCDINGKRLVMEDCCGRLGEIQTSEGCPCEGEYDDT